MIDARVVYTAGTWHAGPGSDVWASAAPKTTARRVSLERRRPRDAADNVQSRSGRKAGARLLHPRRWLHHTSGNPEVVKRKPRAEANERRRAATQWASVGPMRVRSCLFLAERSFSPRTPRMLRAGPFLKLIQRLYQLLLYVNKCNSVHRRRSYLFLL